MVLETNNAGLDALLFGVNKTPIITHYIEQQLSQFNPIMNNFTQRIYDTLQSSYQFLTDKLTQYGILNSLQKQGVSIVDNYFQELTSFEALMNANLTMQRWIMAHPQLRELYLNDNIDGYSNSYQNVFGNEVGEKDYNYRRVMDSVLTSTDDYWQVKYYLEDLLEGDRELDYFEKSKILTTWDAINWLLETCNFDFTNSTADKNNPSKINR